MKFSEAVKALEEGKKITHPSWREGEYVHICNDLFFNSGQVLKNNKGKVTAITYNADGNHGYELYQEPVQFYTFQEIIPFLKAGKRVRRKSWHGAEYRMDNKCVYRITDKSEFLCYLHDLEADDWIVVEDS